MSWKVQFRLGGAICVLSVYHYHFPTRMEGRLGSEVGNRKWEKRGGEVEGIGTEGETWHRKSCCQLKYKALGL